ncbi:MAG: nitrous oxide reductase family maturation protein NosD [Bacteroidetes bacterium]|nr:MAG: nitrous oxide reductase family maturation protein NosD [Bacteroidota bacterium]
MEVKFGHGTKHSGNCNKFVLRRYLSIYLKGLLGAFLFSLLPVVCQAKNLSVGKGFMYRTIREALEQSDTGDSVIVNSGFYSEGALVIDKRIFLRGIGLPVLDGESKIAVITVHASGTHISGFKIQNSGFSDIREIAGIRLDEAHACVIENNYFYNNYFAVYLANSSYCRIQNNRIEGFARTETSSGNGIHLWKGEYNTILNNHISGHRDGIYFEFVKESSIIGNLSEKNLRYGLHFMFSDDDVYKYNVFRENGSGVAVMYTRNVLMENNRFEDNWGSASFGLLLKDISNSIIRNNLFSKNTTGLYIEGSNNTIVRHNEFRRNGWAVRILGDCYEDTLTENNFMANTFDVATNATRNMNYIHRNYWDQYTGYDLDKDKTGDIPFHPVSFYSKLTEESPHTLMMLHSFFVDLLNQTERVVPTITPEAFKDVAPQMKPFIYD